MSRTTIGIPNVLAAILVATHCQGVLAVDWEGDTSTAWADGANWGGVAPANDTTTDIANFNLAAYGGNPVFSPNAGTRSIAGITIGASNGAMTLSGTQLTIGSSGISIDSAAGKLTLSSPTTLAANQEWKTDAALNTSMDVTSTVTLNGNTLTFNTNSALGTTSQRRITITGAINDGSSAGSLIKTGAGRLYLSGNKAFTGGLDIQAGEATLNGTLSSAVDITASGAALAIDNSGSNSSIRGLDGVSGSSVFNRNGAGRTLTINTAAATNFDFAGSISQRDGRSVQHH